MTDKRTDNVPVDWPDEKEHRRKLATAVNGALAGRLNSTSQFVTAGTLGSTTVSDNFCGVTTVVIVVPTSDAANSMDIYPSVIQRGAFVVKHNTLTGTFNYVLIG